ncbi:hypothetical protein MHO82_24105, partial [Vibrio sp. Of7-15]|uniref:hypothetical protein n=1 Tax=Vibrio sp. Of7-15 TaxID=2724879 RepID=UPI001EF3756A
FSDLKRGMYMQFIGDKRVVVNAFGYQIYQGMTNNIYNEGAELLSDKPHINSSRTVPSRIMINPIAGNLKTTVNGGEQFIVDLKTQKISKFHEKSDCLDGKVLINKEQTYAVGLMADYDLMKCKRVNWKWGIAENSRAVYGRPMLYNFQGAEL